jgi:RHS repeat-associated protein
VVSDEGGHELRRVSYYPFGEVRSQSGQAVTGGGYTGQRLSVTGQYHFGAREYDPLTGRFLSPDPFPGFLAAPQSLNPYAYGYNNPIRYSDPSGYDPLDVVWRQAFRQAHGRDPSPLDEQIRLFSLAYSDEWRDQKLDQVFYLADGTVDREAVKRWFQHPPESRKWDTMPAALCGLSQSYTAGEERMFVQDIAMLYAGLAGRRQYLGWRRSYWMAGAQNMEHVYIRAGHINPAFVSDPNLGSDKDMNVHHWVWSFAAGYDEGWASAVAINDIREVGSGLDIGYGSLRWHVNNSDMEMGTRGAMMGSRFSIFGFKELPTLFDLLDIGR